MNAPLPHRRASDNPEYVRALESELAKTERDRLGLQLSHAALSIEAANLRHQLYTLQSELATFRTMRAEMLVDAFERCLQQAESN